MRRVLQLGALLLVLPAAAWAQCNNSSYSNTSHKCIDYADAEPGPVSWAHGNAFQTGDTVFVDCEGPSSITSFSPTVTIGGTAYSLTAFAPTSGPIQWLPVSGGGDYKDQIFYLLSTVSGTAGQIKCPDNTSTQQSVFAVHLRCSPAPCVIDGHLGIAGADSVSTNFAHSITEGSSGDLTIAFINWSSNAPSSISTGFVVLDTVSDYSLYWGVGTASAGSVSATWGCSSPCGDVIYDLWGLTGTGSAAASPPCTRMRTGYGVCVDSPSAIDERRRYR